MKKLFYTLFTFLLFFSQHFNALADSIAGGKMEFTYTGTGDKYKITVTLYVDENFKVGAFNPSLGPDLYSSATMPWVGIYSKGSAAINDVKIKELQLKFESKTSLAYDNIDCVTSKKLATQKIILSAEADIPPATFNNAGGYYIVYQDGQRNFSNNVYQSTTTGITLYVEFPSQSGGKNSSPVFKLTKGNVACKGQPFTIDLGASDSDGNSLSFFADTPYSGQNPVTLIAKNTLKPTPRQPFAVNDYVYATLNAGFSAGSAVPGLSLNGSTGVLSGTPTQEGTFVVTVECRESRGGTQIGVVRQDFEIRVEKCTPPDPKIFLEKEDPLVQLNTTAICSGSYKTLQTAELTNVTYQWFKNGVAVAGATAYKIRLSSTDDGDYTVRVTRATGACSGVGTSTKTIVTTQNGANVKFDIAKKNYCVGQGFIINTIGLPLPASSGFSNIRWLKNKTEITGLPFPAISYPVGSATLADDGLYQLEVTETGGNKCTYEDSVRITISPIPTVSITNVTGKTSVCKGDVVKLQAVASPNVTYQWVRNGADDVTTDFVNVSSLGTYTYGLSVASKTNPECLAYASPTVTVTVNDFPTVTFDNINPVCNAKSSKIDLRNYVSPYDATRGVFSGTGVRGYEFDPALSGYGSFPIKYTYSTPEGCPNEASKTAVVDLTPVIKLGNDFTIFRGDTARIKSVGSVGTQYIYEWTPIAGILPSLTAPQPIVNPVLTTEYKVKVTSLLGKCFAEDKILITVRPRLKFANAFTPNNDAINDTWEIEGIGEYPNAEVTVFNRWGGEMFYSIGYNRSFDGIQNNERLPAGTYFYVIKPSPDVPTLTGYLTIVR